MDGNREIEVKTRTFPPPLPSLPTFMERMARIDKVVWVVLAIYAGFFCWPRKGFPKA